MVKVGIRRRSFKKSFSAKTKGRATRSIKRALIPGYGKRGAGWAHPKRKLYNKVYNKTTIDLRTVGKSTQHRKSTTAAKSVATGKSGNRNGCLWSFIIILGIGLLITYWYIFLAVAVISGSIWYYTTKKRQQAAAQQAEAARLQAAETSKADQIRSYKELLDEGAITQAEFDQQKRRILDEDHDDDKLEF
ncbi:SHOCT domain-containing protein [Lacticaseibacillus baoqingensis]|uniref:SHOCT domain-containing protein n=1 Tax=Lacticaseibacillus baoqingensis TaxID=2486013 RepID=A0ABW4E4S0_9LACO|nr:SHOCT domain-containing protein [Lacticaseibacillus baoqingensis]